jgi:putative nucleotidyltransferase with HDIG domain
VACGFAAFAALGLALTQSLGPLFSPLGATLIVCGIAGDLIAARLDSRVVATGSPVSHALAFAFLGPGPAVVAALVIEFACWCADRYRVRMLPVNLAAVAVPVGIAGVLFASLDTRSSESFYAALTLGYLVYLAFNIGIVAVMSALVDREPVGTRLLRMREVGGPVAVSGAFVIASAGVYREAGLAAVILVLVSILGFTYMARLVVSARERTRQYAALSWGVLSGLIRSLDQRDPRAARHAAAVAAFSRDIAQGTGMDKRDQDLAHTAGLLHDIGRFGLSDRVMEQGTTLTDSDWDTIRRHPEMGADLLRDLGAYGPVAEIVKAHHERVDGRGYPNSLEAGEIPEIAKIVAVAEVYDTLTAEDTYRSRMSSFEALTELRRVSGTQLDSRYVEALAELLAGSGVEYRHADRADFDTELELEKRVTEAADPATQIVTSIDAEAG